MRKILFAALAVLLLLGCQSKKDQLSRIWFYTYKDGAREAWDTLLTPANFINLEGNGRYTMDFDGFDAGRWEVSGDTLVFDSDKRKKVNAIGFRHMSDKDLRLYIDKSVLEFEGMENRSLPEAKNPYSKVNNEWRVPALAKETDKQITARLANHFQFWETYFAWALEENVNYVDVRSTPTPVKIYGNGFTLKPFEQLPAAWKSYFYDEEDCRKANDRIQALFEQHVIAWPHTDNKYKMFLSAFQQLRQNMSSR